MKIVHIGQIHSGEKLEGNLSEQEVVKILDNDATYSVINSQINIAKYLVELLKNSQGNPPLIMHEGFASSFLAHTEFENFYCYDIKKHFSKESFAKDFSIDDYTDIQKLLLYDRGAGIILYCTGDIEMFYGAERDELVRKRKIDDITEDFIYNSGKTIQSMVFFFIALSVISPKLSKYVFYYTGIESYLLQKLVDFCDELGMFLPREIAALEIAQDLTKKMITDTAVIIYGESHDFTEACNKVGCDSLTSVSFEESKGLVYSIRYYLGCDPIYNVVEKEMVLDTNGPIDNQNSYDQTGLGLDYQDHQNHQDL